MSSPEAIASLGSEQRVGLGGTDEIGEEQRDDFAGAHVPPP